MNILFGIFIILHGLVHLLYFGHSIKVFDLKPGMTWPTGSWVFAHILGDDGTRFLVSMVLVLAGFGFIAGGIGILVSQSWSRTLIMVIAILSALLFVIFWNGRLQNLDGQGVVGVLIDVWLFVMVALVRWPQLGA